MDPFLGTSDTWTQTDKAGISLTVARPIPQHADTTINGSVPVLSLYQGFSVGREMMRAQKRRTSREASGDTCLPLQVSGADWLQPTPLSFLPTSTSTAHFIPNFVLQPLVLNSG